jgi:hypothetical protein
MYNAALGADQADVSQTRSASLRTNVYDVVTRFAPGHTQKKTYVFDVRHVGLIDRYAQDHQLDLKDVLYQALEEFFHRRGYVKE